MEARKRWDQFPTPADVGTYFEQYATIPALWTGVLSEQFAGIRPMSKAFQGLIEANPGSQKFSVQELVGFLGQNLENAQDRIEAELVDELWGQLTPDGTLYWELDLKGQEVDRGNNYISVDPHSDQRWERIGNPIPEDIKAAALSVKQNIEELIPSFQDESISGDLEVIFLPTLTSGQFIVTETLDERIGTMYERPERRVDFPSLGTFTYHQYAAIDNGAIHSLMLIKVEDERDEAGNPRNVQAGEKIVFIWTMPDVPHLPHPHFHFSFNKPTQYADSIFSIAKRVVFAPVPKELQHYFG